MPGLRLGIPPADRARPVTRHPRGDTTRKEDGTTDAIALTDVTRSFTIDGRRIDALARITLTVPRGQIAAVVGPSGSGKSTLLRVVSGLLAPDTGRVALAG